MMKRNKLLAGIIGFLFIFNSATTAFAEMQNANPSLNPLQCRLNQVIKQTDVTEFLAENETLPEDFDQATLDEINNNPILVSESETVSETEASEVQAAEASLDIQPLVASTSTTDVPTEFSVEPVNSVYNVLNNNNDYVSQATGALTYEKSLISLPGANGLDLNLKVIYNSGDAVIAENTFEYTSNDVRKINFRNFAIGWNFGFPTIIKSNRRHGNIEKPHLRFPDGSAYKITDDYDGVTTDRILNLEFYKLSDMTLIRKANTNDYVLTYSNGRTETFDGTYGNIKKISDRYGNEINFEYTEFDYSQGSFFDYIFKPSYYKATINTLTKITDSAGREINIYYTINNTAYGNEVKEIHIRMNNSTYASIYLKRVKSYFGNVDIVNKINDGEGQSTNYQYNEKFANIFNNNIAYHR